METPFNQTTAHTSETTAEQPVSVQAVKLICTRLTHLSRTLGRRFSCHTLRHQSPSVERWCAKAAFGSVAFRQSCLWRLFHQQLVSEIFYPSVSSTFRLNEKFTISSFVRILHLHFSRSRSLALSSGDEAMAGETILPTTSTNNKTKHLGFRINFNYKQPPRVE